MKPSQFVRNARPRANPRARSAGLNFIRQRPALLRLALGLVLGLGGALIADAQTVNVLGFAATRNGLKFSNNHWPNVPPWTINLPMVGKVSFGNASSGLCGGMVYLGRDCFDAGLLPPAATANPGPGTPLFTYIVARHTHSLDYDDANQQLSWLTKGDADLVNHLVKEEWPKVKSVIDSGEPCPLVLTHGHARLTDPAAIVRALEGCHQVLAYGYTLQDNHLTLRIWDPNHPSAATSTIRISLAIQGLSATRALNWTTTSGYPTGHFRGFYRSHYSFKDPRKPVTAAFLAQAVLSPGVGGLAPLPPVGVRRVWAQARGNPLIRFSGSIHDLTLPLTAFVADRAEPIEQLMVTIATGGDDLRAGPGPNDNADIFLQVGGHLGNRTLTFKNINCNQRWNNGEIHHVVLPLPPGAASGDVESLRLHTQFGGGLSGDNWSVNGLKLEATLANSRP